MCIIYRRSVPRISDRTLAIRPGERLYMDVTCNKQCLRPVDKESLTFSAPCKRNWQIIDDKYAGFKYSAFFHRTYDEREPTYKYLTQLLQHVITFDYLYIDNTAENKHLNRRIIYSAWKLRMTAEYTTIDTTQQSSLPEFDFCSLINRARASQGPHLGSANTPGTPALAGSNKKKNRSNKKSIITM